MTPDTSSDDAQPTRLAAGRSKAETAAAASAAKEIWREAEIDLTDRRPVSHLPRANEPRFRALVESSMDVIVITNELGEVHYISPSCREVLGWAPDEIMAMDMHELVGKEEDWDALATDIAVAAGETSPLREMKIRHRDGTLRWLIIRATNLLEDPAILGIVVNCRDITERKLVADELELTRAHASSVLDTAGDAFIQTGLDGRVTEWNRQAEKTYGWSRAEALGERLEQLIVPVQHRTAFRAGLVNAVDHLPAGGVMTDSVEFTALRRDGSEFPIEITSWVTMAHEGKRLNTFLRNITVRKALEEQLSHDALHDELTGLPNRSLLWDSLQHALKRAVRTRERVAVLFCDLDQFKVVNDSLGHSVGDELLRSVARRLEKSIRGSDTVGRFGGDEFVIVFDGVVGELEASDLGQRVLQVFQEPFKIEGTELFVTASIGIAVGGATDEAESLLRDADVAMYRAKEKGRACMELFDDSLRVRANARHDLDQALRRALEQDEFRVLYQPVVSLDDGDIVGAEALVRWMHPERGLVGPSEFIGLAEDSGLIVPLGAWVLEMACRQLQLWKAAAPDRDLTMAVNLSARQLGSTTLLDDLTHVLDLTDCTPDTLTLELTESVLMGDVDRSLPTLERLKAIGVKIAIDDFGTGYSSLSYLRRLPIDTLKIDKSFIENFGTDPQDAAIVDAITTMGTIFGQDIVAEGVETRRHAELVKQHRCAYAQGYFFSRPVEGEDFTDLVRDGTRYELATTGT